MIMTQPAKVLAAVDVRRVVTAARRLRHGTRNEVMVLLSYKAGLRACEIAGLTWGMVLDPRGNVNAVLTIANTIAKNGRGRMLPVHPDLRAALKRHHSRMDCPTRGPVILSQRGAHMTPRSVVNWFAQLYAGLGFDGCSSHSGRRTFITQAARMVCKTGGSLRDVQELAGHRSIEVTASYIEGHREAQRRLVRML
jgi:integrase/recombinase XerD